ncbi:MAG: VCBS repeat-containing protein, partial [Candidatus Deferrimicrobiaceae bacterium]
ASDDVDGDGDPDVAVADHGNEVVHLFENVGGTLMPPSMLPAGEELASVLLADFNNDGDADLVTSNKVAGTLPGESISVRLGDVGGTFGDPQEYLAGRGASGMAAANLTPGPSKDLAVTDTERGAVWVLTVGAGGIPLEVDTDLDGIGDELEDLLFLDYLDPDSDDDGLPDGLDPDVIAVVIETIPTPFFSSPGQKKAFLGQLAGLDHRNESFKRGEGIATGEVFHPTENQLLLAIGRLEDLFTRFDGCLGQKEPDKSDWIIDCNAQFQVQSVFQVVLTNYYSIIPLQQQLPPGK